MSSLTSLPYFHGTIDTRECREILTELGDFLVRNYVKATDATDQTCVLTMAVTTGQASAEEKLVKDCSLKLDAMPRLKSYLITADPSGVSFTVQGTSESFPTVQSLCESYVSSKTPFPNGGMLLHPVPRRPWQLLLSDIDFPNPEIVLGSGSFGKVIRAKLLRQGAEPVEVAMKSLTAATSMEMSSEMYIEARAMRALEHPNIIKLHGVVIENLPIYLVIEFLEGSSLHKALTEKRVSDVMRFPIIQGILYGVLHMHTHDYIHRDIATRNVMVSNDCRTVKLIDFGLAKHGLEFYLSNHSKIPVKWLAPETRRTFHFSTKSDTWALGVTMWEVFHDGAEPVFIQDTEANTPVANTPACNTPVQTKQKKVKDSVTRKRTKQQQQQQAKEKEDAKGKEKREKDRVRLPITQNVDWIPKHFDSMYKRMFETKPRHRIELAHFAHQCETVILPTLPAMVATEFKYHLEKRTPFDPKFQVILKGDSVLTQPTVPKASPVVAVSSKTKPKEGEMTERRKGATAKSVTKSGNSASIPEKGPPKPNEKKTKTARRKK